MFLHLLHTAFAQSLSPPLMPGYGDGQLQEECNQKGVPSLPFYCCIPLPAAERSPSSIILTATAAPAAAISAAATTPCYCCCCCRRHRCHCYCYVYLNRSCLLLHITIATTTAGDAAVATATPTATTITTGTTTIMITTKTKIPRLNCFQSPARSRGCAFLQQHWRAPRHCFGQDARRVWGGLTLQAGLVDSGLGLGFSLGCNGAPYAREGL